MWRGCLRPAFLLWVVGRSIPFGLIFQTHIQRWIGGLGREGGTDSVLALEQYHVTEVLQDAPCAGRGTILLSASLTSCGNSCQEKLPPKTLSRITPGPLLLPATCKHILYTVMSYQEHQILSASTMCLAMDKRVMVASQVTLFQARGRLWLCTTDVFGIGIVIVCIFLNLRDLSVSSHCLPRRRTRPQH